MKKEEYVISLGEDCLTGIQLNNLGYRSVSFPFDWLGYEGDCYLISAVDLMCNNFFNFFELNNLQDRGPSGCDNCRLIYDQASYFRMKHDFPLKEEYDKFYPIVKAKYTRRIARLFDILKSPVKVCFIHMNYERPLNEETIKEQCGRLQNKFPLCTMRFLIIKNDASYKRFQIDQKFLKKNILLVTINNSREISSNPNNWFRNEEMYLKSYKDFIEENITLNNE